MRFESREKVCRDLHPKTGGKAQEKICMGFMDFWDALWLVLRMYYIDKLLNVIKSMYVDNQACVCKRGGG